MGKQINKTLDKHYHYVEKVQRLKKEHKVKEMMNKKPSKSELNRYERNVKKLEVANLSTQQTMD